MIVRLQGCKRNRPGWAVLGRICPEVIDMASEGIESADFLTEERKRDILCNDAARLLRRDPDKTRQ